MVDLVNYVLGFLQVSVAKPFVESAAQVYMVLACALIMGGLFGLIFGVMDVEARRFGCCNTCCKLSNLLENASRWNWELKKWKIGLILEMTQDASNSKCIAMICDQIDTNKDMEWEMSRNAKSIYQCLCCLLCGHLLFVCRPNQDEVSYQIRLALLREERYCYPVGALLGGLEALQQ